MSSFENTDAILVNAIETLLLQCQDLSDLSHLYNSNNFLVLFLFFSMKLNSFNIPSASLVADPTVKGVTLNANSLSLALHGDWRYSAKIAGYVNVSIKDQTLNK